MLITPNGQWISNFDNISNVESNLQNHAFYIQNRTKYNDRIDQSRSSYVNLFKLKIKKSNIRANFFLFVYVTRNIKIHIFCYETKVIAGNHFF